jgi:hypothetical protein
MKSVKQYLTTTLAKRQMLSCLALTLLAGAIPANATQIIRDLWDGQPNGPMSGRGSGPTSLGLDTNSTWSVSPTGGTGLNFDGWNIDDWLGIDGNTMLGPSGGGGALIAYYGGNMGSLTNPATSLPYGHYYSQCYATRALAPSAYVDFNANGTYYFSVRILKGVSIWPWLGDNAGGIGLASSGATNANFVGMGISRGTLYSPLDGSTNISDSPYITAGTLDQGGSGFNNDGTTGLPTDGGPYYPRAYGTNTLPSEAGVLVGKLTTSVGGSSTMSIKLFKEFAALPLDPGTITWDATYSFTETSVMTHLLVWQYGTGPSIQDALRVGTTWADVIGIELAKAIQASPSATVYAGTTVTLSQSAGLNNTNYPMTFQWSSNGVPILDATNSSLVLSGTTVDFTADYNIEVSNSFGTRTNNPIHLTFNPGVAPFFTVQPATPIVRYAGGSASLTVAVDGTPPYGLQLKHAGTNIPGATASLSGPGSVTLSHGPLTIGYDATSFSVTATNLFGSTNSDNATVTFITPPVGSFEAAAVANGAVAFWKLSDSTNGVTTNGVALKEYMSGLDGLVPNESDLPSWTNVQFGAAGPGPVLPGFSGITAIETPLQGGLNAQVNLPSVPYSNQMTLVCWTKILGAGSEGLFFDRNKDVGTNYYGINNFNGSLGSRWGGPDTQWNTGITLPTGRWIMVALVVEPEETTLYAGTDPYTLQSVTRTSITGTHTNIPGALPNGRLVVGRTDYSWATGGNAWGYVRGQYCDAAVFHQALSPAAISNLFVAGFGTGAQVIATNGAGNLGLDWYPSLTLQEADEVTGPYTDVVDPNTLLPVVPPYTVPINLETNKMFYRVYQVLP